MDVALGPRRARRYKEDEKMVLILVVMDVALGHGGYVCKIPIQWVLILVVMDVALGLESSINTDYEGQLS